MDRIWQWAWDRYGTRYRWAVYLLALPVALPVWFLMSFMIVAFEKSDRYVEAAAITFAAVSVLQYANIRLVRRSMSLAEQVAAGHEVDRSAALEASYSDARSASRHAVWTAAVWAAILSVIVGAVVGAPPSRLVQYAVLGAAFGAGVQLIAIRSIVESVQRPVRVALAGETAIGDALPRSRPSFATWSNVAVVAVAFAFAVAGAELAAGFGPASRFPIVAFAIGAALTLAYAVPISVGFGFAPSLRPIRDLAAGADRVAAGDYSQRLPVVQDDDLGALAASFNRMQTGLAERQRLQGAFGTYVDPALAARLLDQGDDVFTGERREVSVMFVDIRDFTPFAEANSAEDTVARLNALFDIVVPAVVDRGGHVNKFLGDGALAVFGAPNDLADHADAALNAAMDIQRLVADRFTGELRVGIGINTGVVIAGTIGGAGKLEFTLIGDAVNVAARVEQLTKTTGDVILLTEQSVAALTAQPSGLRDRGSHALKGKTSEVRIFGLAPQV